MMSEVVNVINEGDARAMVRLLGATAACPGQHQEKKRFLMDGLGELIHADAWLWTLTCKMKPDEPQVHVGYLRGGFDEAQFANFLKAIEHPALSEGSRLFFENLTENMQHTTMGRQQMDPEGKVALSGAQPFLTNANIGDLILSGYPLDGKSMSAMGIYRSLSGGEFTEREKRMAHIVLSEVPWLHMSGWPDDRGVTVPQLFPRQRMVLNLLLDGLGRKKIAQHLEITENTVAGYVKDIYKHFGVSSQPELMQKFLAANRDS
jgi:DNA-binding CsgD family transcriptional regulator